MGPLSRLRERVRVRARALRSHSTDAERILWFHLRDRRLGGFKFRRQHPVGPFFADFVCIEGRLVVELDGGQHFESGAAEADRQRTSLINQLGFAVVRFTDREALKQTQAVLAAILARLGECAHPHPSPLPPAGERVQRIDPEL
ncbi:endonuclease domain-containing protein [Piscinibacter sakaiensis]|uniref:endonuclease domain-containing protein n=1 Tax=Piscinibacter sakaiensis TaxID=1547922 RepID=UPI003AAD8FD0